LKPLIAMDIIPVYPENHGAMIGASKMGVDLCEKAEQMGYSRDLCSYAMADIACAPINGGPIGGIAPSGHAGVLQQYLRNRPEVV
jgi:benzoyl-CoA reductase/2-hydroxyglutaryl-CoA dehydratase subunit BcrC/BadD/HgdB